MNLKERLSEETFIIKVSVDVLPMSLYSPLKVNTKLLFSGNYVFTVFEGRPQNLSLPVDLIFTDSGLDLRNSTIDNVISLSLEPNLIWAILDPSNVTIEVTPPKSEVKVWKTTLYAHERLSKSYISVGLEMRVEARITIIETKSLEGVVEMRVYSGETSRIDVQSLFKI